jgi:Acyl-CoA thioesterase C-terminal domain/Acyl-CoA thioesterase N-terminal domain
MVTAIQTSREDDVSALFVPEGKDLVPTTFAVGPWRPDAVHGSAVAALFAAALDEPEATVARITMDLLGAVPLQPLRMTVRDVEGGRRVRRRTALLHHEDRVVAQATALLVTESADLGLPAREGSGSSDPPPKALALLPASRAGWDGFESQSMALHTAHEGSRTMLGWFRLLHPAIAGQPLTGLQMLLAAADYTSGGTAVVLSLKRWTFVSTDLTVNLTRRPTGDWIGLAATSTLGPAGIGVATGVLHDAAGEMAHCTQTQFIEQRR